MTDRIALQGLRVRGFHGVLPSERRDGQDFIVDLVLHLDTKRAAATDDLNATVNYADLAHRVSEVVAGEPVDLIETLAERVAQVALASGGGIDAMVESVEVTIHKPSAPIPLDFQDVSVSVRRRARREVVLSLGSNLGDRQATLHDAVAALRRIRGFHLNEVSDWYEAPPVGGPEQGPYLNAVVTGTTSLSPRRLLQATSRIEQAAGRVREVRWGPRTLDIDIIDHDGILSDDPELTLPHPRAHERAFVLVPWAQLRPDAILPGHGRVSELAAAVAGRGDVVLWQGER